MNFTIGILGAGALGSLYAHELGSAPSNSCFFIADKERSFRLRASNLSVNGRALSCDILLPEEKRKADLLIIALKYHHLGTALPLADSFVGPDTTIISVMNGVDSEEIIAARFGKEHLLHCLALGMDAVREGSKVTYTTPGKIVAGRAGADETAIEKDPDIARLKAICGAASFPLEIRRDILKALWWKFMINIGVNQVSAISGTSYRYFQDRNSHAHALMNEAMKELIQVAQMKHIDLSEKDITAWYSVLDTLGPEGKTSMLQDMEAGRKTEVEMFAGILLDFGRELGLELPVNRTLFQLIRSREAAAGII